MNRRKRSKSFSHECSTSINTCDTFFDILTTLDIPYIILSTELEIIDSNSLFKDKIGKMTESSKRVVTMFIDGTPVTGKSEYNGMVYADIVKQIATDKVILMFKPSIEMLAEQISQTKNRFIANISHEIRTPLSGIVGFVDILRDTELTSIQQEYVNTITDCSTGLMSIINDVLDMAKLNAREMKFDIEEMSLRKCLEESYDTICLDANQKNIELIFEIKPDVPNVLLGDFNRIKQILINILNNAVKFTTSGHISTIVSLEPLESDEEIELESHLNQSQNVALLESSTDSWSSTDSIIEFIEKSDRPGPFDIEMHRIKFQIEDTGIGIPKHKQNYIFESFTQLNDSNKRGKREGTGLGLSICKKLCELMGGKISVSSEPNEGSVFTFTLVLPAVIRSSVESCTESKSLNDLTVLIVDDTDRNRLILSQLCIKWGMKPTMCSSGDEALMYTRNGFDYDIGLIDMIMPKMNGYELGLKLQKSQPNMKLILLSSIGDYLDIGDKYGINKRDLFSVFNNISTKPVKADRLFEMIYNCIHGESEYTNKKKSVSCYRDNRINILVVDDVLYGQNMLRIYLDKLGYSNVDTTSNGQEALNMIAQKGISHYDIVFLDIKMPVLDGVSMFYILRGMYSKTDLPYICALTAVVETNGNQFKEKMGMDDYVLKPVTMKQIEDVMDRMKKCIGR